MNKYIFSIIIAFVLTTALAFTQSGPTMKLSIGQESKLSLEGNSTMHEYSAKASQLLGSAVVDSFLFTEKNNARSFLQADITIPVKKLSSGNEKLDDKMYDALEADDNPNITYHLTSDSITFINKDTCTIKLTGTLTVAGKQKSIEMTATLLKHQNNSVNIRGSKELLMTDFGVEPPSMMFGLLKTEDKVIIRFDLLLQQ